MLPGNAVKGDYGVNDSVTPAVYWCVDTPYWKVGVASVLKYSAGNVLYFVTSKCCTDGVTSLSAGPVTGQGTAYYCAY